MKAEVEGLRQRMKAFALRVIRLYSSLPKNDVTRVLGQQVLRSGTSAGAQYREACRSRSDAELISKLESVLQELDETGYWFELLIESGSVKPNLLSELQQEADELMAMLVTSVKGLKNHQRSRP